MATQVQTKSNTWQGSINIDGKASYTVGYTVRTDDLELGADCILSLDELPTIGDRYDLLDDEVNNAFVMSKTAKQKSPGFWEVTVKVANDPGSGSEEKGKGQTADDIPTEDWKEIGATIDVSSFRVSRAPELGAYIGKLEVKRQQGGAPALNMITGAAAGWIPPNGGGIPQTVPNATKSVNFLHHIGNGIPLTNSAYVPFDPPPEIEYSRMKIVITRLHEEYPTKMMKYIDTVNLKPVKIDINDFRATLEPFTAKLQGISGRKEYNAGDPYWRVNYEIEYDPLFTWRIHLLDQGYRNVNEDLYGKSYDDQGNAIASRDENSQWLEVAKDMSGLPVQDPIKLDGMGQPTEIANNYSIYLTYAVYPELNWSPLKFHVEQPIINMLQ
jgi:hypothetical protein